MSRNPKSSFRKNSQNICFIWRDSNKSISTKHSFFQFEDVDAYLHFLLKSFIPILEVTTYYCSMVRPSQQSPMRGTHFSRRHCVVVIVLDLKRHVRKKERKKARHRRIQGNKIRIRKSPDFTVWVCLVAGWNCDKFSDGEWARLHFVSMWANSINITTSVNLPCWLAGWFVGWLLLVFQLLDHDFYIHSSISGVALPHAVFLWLSRWWWWDVKLFGVCGFLDESLHRRIEWRARGVSTVAVLDNY